VVGVKPSFGLVPQWPLGAFGHVAVAGPMTRSVKDAALMLGTLAGYHKADPFSLDLPRHDYMVGIEEGVRGMKIGILRHPGFDADAGEEEWGAVEQARLLLEQQGAVVSEIDVNLPDVSWVFQNIWGAALARQAALTPADRRGDLDPGILAVADKFRDVSGQMMVEAEALRVLAAHIMAGLEVDAILCPTVPQAASLVDEVFADPVQALWKNWAPWTFLYNLTRQPALSVPVGVNKDGLPLAVQIAAKLYRDDVALKIGFALERALG
jgi:aspartyl-tRNA(Asn)/glutamyl-tRNA(Gln) amidotransferase subunit A